MIEAEFHFLRPFWFLAMLPLLLLLWLLWHRTRRAGRWETVCDPRLLPHILIARNAHRSRWPIMLFGVAGLLAITALAGPAWERLPAPMLRDDSYLVIALDLSRSMDAADLKPSRLSRARFKIEDVLKRRKEGQTALVVYADDAFVVTPLTDDTETLRHQLGVLSPAMMPAQGSNAASALRAAGRLLKRAGAPAGQILLITDGINVERDLEAARVLESQSYRTSVLGVGTEKGGPIPLEGGFLKDRLGNIVVPKLDPGPLKRLASIGGGRYRRIASDSADVETLLMNSDGVLERRGRGTDLNVERWVEEGPWLVLPLLLLAAFGFRRGLLGVVFALLLPAPEIAHGVEWKDLWATPNQRAGRAFADKDYEEAARRFRNAEWKSAAQYRAEKYREAAKTLEGMDTAEAHYNRGNALAMAGQFPEAIAAYDQALALAPAHADARYNKKRVEELLSQRQAPQENQEQEQEQEQEQGQGQKDPAQGDHADSGQSDADSQPPPSSADNGGQPESERMSDADSATSGDPKEEGQDSETEAKKADAGTSQDDGMRDAESEAAREESRQGEAKQQDPAAAQASSEVDSQDESQQASEQWLRRIPDDPGGLLRRKFEYQYKQRNNRRDSESEPW